MKSIKTLLFAGILMASRIAVAQRHPSLMLTAKNIGEMKAGISKYPLLGVSYQEVQHDADKAIARPIHVPTPADGGGGITHEQHKENYKNVLDCGIAYQLTGDAKYAQYVKDMLFAYAKVYNTWGRHPKRKEEPGGKI